MTGLCDWCMREGELTKTAGGEYVCSERWNDSGQDDEEEKE